MDFMIVSTRTQKNGTIEIYPKLKICPSKDLMIRGSDFYAIWVEEKGLWSTREQDALELIDRELERFYEEHKDRFSSSVRILRMTDAESGMIDAWHKYCQKQMRDNFHMLDECLIFSNSPTNKKDYASKRLPYPLEACKTPSYDKLIGTLYTEEERHKLEWAIGSIVSGDSKTLQKFMVLYGSAGTGKSTILNIIQMLFDGYYSVFDAKALGSSSNSFALEAFKTNPLVAIQHDGDLSRIEDNTRLNSLVSHELMTVNEKFKSTYANRFKAFLFMGTNKPVKITDAKSGLLRRLIDVTPSGNKVPGSEYNKCMKQIPFELGGIATHCLKVFEENPEAYDDYIPLSMFSASNDFYNFVNDSYTVFEKDDYTTLRTAWEMYKNYVDDAKVAYPLSQRAFKEELKNYFYGYFERQILQDGTRVRNCYMGFRKEKFDDVSDGIPESKPIDMLDISQTKSFFNDNCKNYIAQYANQNGTPYRSWAKVTTRLSDIDPTKLHYVNIDNLNHIVIDFDLKENGKKSLKRNLEEAAKWPPTYAELSKSGCGVHLHYFYDGDTSKLSNIYDDNIEIKTFAGNAPLRRMFTKCNNLPIAHINSGLPLKGEKMVAKDVVQSEKGLRTTIKKCLNKEVHPDTTSNVNFIYDILEKAYNGGLKYDVTDMRNTIYTFCASSTNQAKRCCELFDKMHFKSDEPSISVPDVNDDYIFFDIEVFPNLFVIVWKKDKDDKLVRMINPTPNQVEEFIYSTGKKIGFNNRRYDNHVVYAAMLGYATEQLYELSQKIISNDSKNCTFSEAYNLSFTDIYDFASAGNKMSLKKLEIEMGIHHQELGLPWDQPVPEELWTKVAEYCDNDVIATEAAFYYLAADFTAREILSELAGLTCNDTTNTLTTRIIFGKEKKPQGEFNYRNLADPIYDIDEGTMAFLKNACPDMMSMRHGDNSLLPYFPGYTFRFGKSTYKGFEVGEGGFVYARTGMYGDVALLDIASMHPHSVIAECLFGPTYTTRFRDIVEGRVSIKHEDWNEVNKMLDGKLTPFVQRVIDGKMTSEQLADALKTAINSVYGLTSAKFENPFKDNRNIDNIVAKRGALFMINLKEEVEKRGYTVAHIKTDSIKIPDADNEIIEFVMNYGKQYGYTFEHEATYDKMCLVNDAVYIAKYATDSKCKDLYGYVPKKNKKKGGHWTATGTQFQVPYVFKTLFSGEDLEFSDMCETKSVTSSLYLDMNEGYPDVSQYEKLLDIRSKLSKGKEITKKDAQMLQDYSYLSDEDLNKEIAKGHNYVFIGRVGQFCPILDGKGGGTLVREKDGKMFSVGGTKGYKWLESEMVQTMHKEEDIDKSYYKHLADEAIESIGLWGDAEWFRSEDTYCGDIPGSVPF